MGEYEEIVKTHKNLPHYSGGIVKDDQLYYQYRDFKSFWSILESDSFWATNALFCNDTQEQKFGRKVIAGALKSKNKGADFDIDSLSLDENYIVCFCKEDDKLSQWRGYANKGGVSMGYDFHVPQKFAILKKKTDITDITKMGNCKHQYASLEKVKYIAEGDDYYRELDLAEDVADANFDVMFAKETRRRAPYIKHEGFKEETESRLVFSNYDGSLDECIRRRYSESGLLQFPYIVVSAYQDDSGGKVCHVRVCIRPERENELVSLISDAISKEHGLSGTSVFGCHLQDGMAPDIDASFCKGCTVRKFDDLAFNLPCRYAYPAAGREYEYCLGDNYCVMITAGNNQKELYEKVHECVREFNELNKEQIPVWCEGHLPLRSLTVGPCPNQSDMVTAIKHYCKHTYWLRDVKIGRSHIPYRESM